MKTFSSESIHKILVPIDGSDYSNRAAEYAIGIAKERGAEVVLVYVVDELVVDQFSSAAEKSAIEAQLKSDGQRAVRYAESLLEQAGVKSSSMLLKGRPFEQIVNTTKSFNIDLVVMGTYGRRGAERILIGSVAERVIEYSPCPVLVIK